MDLLQQEWVKNLITLGSVIAAILAWVAKLRWSKEYSDAKEEQIKSKQAHIDLLERENKTLRDNTLDKVLERYRVIQKNLEEFIEKLGKDLDDTKKGLMNKEIALTDAGEREELLKSEISQKEEQIKKARFELTQIKALQATSERIEQSRIRVNKRFFDLLREEAKMQHLDFDENRYTPIPLEPEVDDIIEWFLENYKDPVHGVPWDEGEYVYVYGGPYHADEELRYHFPDIDESIIDAAVDVIENDGTFNWVKEWQY